jgi:hypothetical protein
MAFQLVRGPAPPPFTPQGHQPNFGPLHLAIAHTQYGNIPCKAAGNKAWYPYGGKEHETSDFSWVVAAGHQMVRNAGGPPPRAIACGHQPNFGPLFGAIAHTPHGNIPGKAAGNECWYPYGGAEHTTHDFDWIVSPPFMLLRHQQFPQPGAATPQGHQPNFGPLWVAIAHAPEGNVPGKASGNTCWYPFGGRENTTSDFSWVEVPGHQLVRNTGFQPPNAVVAGNQPNFGPLCIAIAHTPHGNIPAKAAGNNCWYPFGGQEHSTNDFSWICN